MPMGRRHIKPMLVPGRGYIGNSEGLYIWKRARAFCGYYSDHRVVLTTPGHSPEFSSEAVQYSIRFGC